MITTIIQIVSVFLVVLQVYLLNKQIRIASKQLKDNNEWNRIQASISIINRYNGIINQVDNRLLDKTKLLSLQARDLQKSEINLLLQNTSNRKQLFLLCNYFEELALGVKFKYLNETIVMEQLYTPVVCNYENLNAYIQLRRIETKMNVCGNFEWLAERWKMKTSKAKKR